MSIKDADVYLVSYRRGDEFPSTNIVHASSMAAIDCEFEDCGWYSIRTCIWDHEVSEAKAKGMPERWL